MFPICFLLEVSAVCLRMGSGEGLQSRATDGVPGWTQPSTAHPLTHPNPGVLTKLDIMDRGTDAVGVLRNEAVPLQLGFVGVVLRSQEDIANRRSMADARAAERGFFEAHPEYLEVAAQVLTSYLVWLVTAVGGVDGCLRPTPVPAVGHTGRGTALCAVKEGASASQICPLFFDCIWRCTALATCSRVELNTLLVAQLVCYHPPLPPAAVWRGPPGAGAEHAAGGPHQGSSALPTHQGALGAGWHTCCL